MRTAEGRRDASVDLKAPHGRGGEVSLLLLMDFTVWFANCEISRLSFHGAANWNRITWEFLLEKKRHEEL